LRWIAIFIAIVLVLFAAYREGSAANSWEKVAAISAFLIILGFKQSGEEAGALLFICHRNQGNEERG
jgi:hypothetical protein